MKLVNLACGHRFHKDWVNVDFASKDPNVMNVNLLGGTPFESNSFDVVYHSHVIEHFTPELGRKFLAECFRILKPGGVIRVATPNLEVIAQNYLKFLEEANEGSKQADANYNWTLIEMYDQVVRHESGGEFKKYIFREHIPNEDFVYERNGYEAHNLRSAYLTSVQPNKSLKSSIFQWLLSVQKTLENNITFYRYYRVGRLRLNGEVHLKMYDRYSLGSVLKEVGFVDPVKVSAIESSIPKWDIYQWLDIEEGTVRKPDSLFMEARKSQA
jgi:predicted SAM-dependent methyltransferase